jgi:hypothetical protein
MDYGTLKSDTASYLHRSDLTALIPAFVEKARVRIGRDLRSLEQEAYGALSAPTDSVFALPAAFNELRRAESDGHPLRSVSATELAWYATSASPWVYCIRGREITVPGAATVDIWYFAIEAKLVLDATELPTMAAHPQVWQLATLAEAGLYLQDWELLDRCTVQYGAEVQGINARAERARQGRAPAAVNSDIYIAFGGPGL